MTNMLRIPPGEYLAEVMQWKGITREELAEKTGLSLAGAVQLIRGFMQIDQELAGRLETVTGFRAEFWLELEANS